MQKEERIIPLGEKARLRVFWDYDEVTTSDDYLGTYGNEPKPWCIDRKNHTLLDGDLKPIRKIEHRTYHLSGTDPYFYTNNYSPKDLENEAYQDYFIADYLSAELWNQGEWNYQGCVCDLEIKMNGCTWSTLLSNSILGVEDNTSQQHKLNVEEDVIESLKYEFRDQSDELVSILHEISEVLSREE